METRCNEYLLHPHHYYRQLYDGIYSGPGLVLGGREQFRDHPVDTYAYLAVCARWATAARFDWGMAGSFCGAQGQMDVACFTLSITRINRWNTTTANRHHPGESVFRFVFTTMAVIIIGAPMWIVFLYQTMSVVLTQFNHSNVKMPDWLDNALVLVICTPNMHRVHHHYRMPYTDSNYGNIFSFWDRMFGTFMVADNEKLIYGVDTHMNKEESENVMAMLKIPFKKYRSHHDYEQEEVL